METTPTASNFSLPEEISIPVPQSFKDYLIPRRALIDLRIIVLYALLLLGFVLQWKSGHHHTYTIVGLFIRGLEILMTISIHFLIWQHDRKRKWNYVLTPKSINLIAWRSNGKRWLWHDLYWTQEVISRIDHAEWRGLPSLCIHTAAKEPKNRQTLYLVYAHEDSKKIQTQMLPMIEHCRQEYRHDYWAAEWPG